MRTLARIDPIKSKLGREIYGLVALLASLPLIIVGVFSLYQIDSAYQSQAQHSLEKATRSFGEAVHTKLLQSQDLAFLMIDELLAKEDLPAAFQNYSVIRDGAIIHSTFGENFGMDPAVTETHDHPKISFRETDAGSQTFFSLTVDSKTFVGELDQFALWGNSTLYPFATEFCIVAPSMQKPIFCSMPIPAEQIDTIRNSDLSRGSADWVGSNESWRSTYWELFLPSSFVSDPLRIVGSQPLSIINGASSAYRNIYFPGLFLTLVIALVGAGYYARRYLQPIASLLWVTERFAVRDFSATADIQRDDEFKDLSVALNNMGEMIDRQFQAQEAMSRLGQLILGGNSMEDVFRTGLCEALSYLPYTGIELDVDIDGDDRQTRYAISRAGNAFTRSAVDEAALTEHDGHLAESIDIMTSGKRRGEIRGFTDQPRDTDAVNESILKTLAERLSMTLEFTEKNIELNRRAWFDDLTDLPNRESCFRKLDRAINAAELNGQMVALLYIDLDGFKSVNDSFGHDIGDKLIRLAAERITLCVGHYGTTARLGGDEFAVILPYSNGGEKEYKKIGDAILEQLQKPFRLGNSEAFLGASIGVARYPEDGLRHGELLRNADAAMYRAKDSGRGCQVDFSQTLGIVIAKRLSLEADLNRALERNEMRLVYQPQVDLRTRAVVGAEALLRWHHSTEGLIPPDEFIPVAEETNQIITLGNWVLFNACEQFSEWRNRGVDLKKIAVNVSPNQLRNNDFVQHVRECLDRFDLSPDMLDIELTEGVFVDSQDTTACINELKKLGVEISIDDFGTGYSSLGYLKNLEFDKVKVDRSFVSSLPADKQSASIIQAVLGMCKTLGKPVVAEGIETSEQLQYLTDAGVEYAQGYYFGKPMDPGEFEQALNAVQDMSSTMINFKRLKTS